MSANHDAPDETWMLGAPCAENSDLFFPYGYSGKYRQQIEQAKDECLGCDRLTACREAILRLPTYQDRHGIYAALTPDERKALRKDRDTQARDAAAPEGTSAPKPPAARQRVDDRPERTWDDCGTPAAKSRHGRRLEPACATCVAAETSKRRAKREEAAA